MLSLVKLSNPILSIGISVTIRAQNHKNMLFMTAALISFPNGALAQGIENIPAQNFSGQNINDSNVPEASPIEQDIVAAQNRDTDTKPQIDKSIEFAADDLNYDDEIVIASGNVVLNRDGYTLFADTVIWDRNTGIVKASGNIRSLGPDGEIAYGDEIQLSDNLRDGIIENLLLVLDNGARLAAAQGRTENDVIILENAAYSPCRVEKSPGCPKRPNWQIRAVKVFYDKKNNRVKYEGARIEIFGLPLIPLPGLSHPADLKYGSGFLVPDARIGRVNGVELEIPYYWRISENRDLTLTGRVFSRVAPLAKAQFRSLEKNGAFQVTGYGTVGRPIALDAPGQVLNSKFRGYFDANGKFQLTPEWSVSASARLASDRTFLRRYDISNEDRLRSTFSAERIDKDSYFSLSGYAVQTLRLNTSQGQTPIALPVFDYRQRFSDPALGGKLELRLNTLAIGRTNGQDTQRAFAQLQWDRRLITKLGQEVKFTLLGRGDLYNSDENELTPVLINRGESGFQGRAIGTGAVDVKWPFAGKAFGGFQTLTPRVQLVATPTVANLRLPNEDSRAVDLEDTNLFALNRFPGSDRIEDDYRVTVGVDWDLKLDNIAINATIGQSYRLSNQQSILPDGTGLSEKTSDVTGRTQFRYKDFIKLTHRYRVDKDNFAIRRNEIDTTIGSDRTYFQASYLRLNRDISFNIEDLSDREEVRLGGRAQLARHWSIFGSAIVDLTDFAEDPLSQADGFDPVRSRLGLEFNDDCCLSIGVTWRRDFQDSGDARRGNTFLFRVAFRNLGV